MKKKAPLTYIHAAETTRTTAGGRGEAMQKTMQKTCVTIALFNAEYLPSAKLLPLGRLQASLRSALAYSQFSLQKCEGSLLVFSMSMSQ